MTVISPTPFPRCQIGGVDHRFVLAERWSNAPLIGFLGMNPSDASDAKPDPTWSRGGKFARAWGFGGQVWMNPVCLRSPSPELALERLRRIVSGKDAAGLALMEENFRMLSRHAAAVAGWVVGWGDKGAAMNEVFRCHGRAVTALRVGGATRFFAFGVTAGGNPKHLLARGASRIPDDAALREFHPEGRRLGPPLDIRVLAR